MYTCAMARMVRKQIYITKEQDERLKRLAREHGLTEAEVLRLTMEGKQPPEDVQAPPIKADTRRKLARRRPAPEKDLPVSRADIYRDYPRRLDPQAWLDELEFIGERARLMPEGGSTTTWRREDSYDERRSRLSS